MLKTKSINWNTSVNFPFHKKLFYAECEASAKFEIVYAIPCLHRNYDVPNSIPKIFYMCSNSSIKIYKQFNLLEH